MSSGEKIFLVVWAIFLAAAISGISFAFGVGYAVEKFNIDLFSIRIGEYVKLKEPVNIANGEGGASILLPEGTLLYYDKSYKNTTSFACLHIIEDSAVFEDRVEYIPEPGSYFMRLSKKEREAYEGLP